ncbi:MAG: alpha/beta hydrolase [Acidimicrobiales bacterium]|nr:alpha/beta hydrolase [Acidimicrobiales bacterium]
MNTQSGNAQSDDVVVEIEYESFGYDGDPLLVLVPGYGAQLLFYPEEFCQGLVDRGFWVVRMDNRDAGLSSRVPGGYGLEDMAADVRAVIDDVQSTEAHVMGFSMGGMIAQMVGHHHADVVKSLALTATASGNRNIANSEPHVVEALLADPVEGGIDERVAADVEARRIWASPEWHDDDLTAEYFRRVYERGGIEDGSAQARQSAAIAQSGNRDDIVRGLTQSITVIHGAEDPLIPPANGEHLAGLVDHAELLLVDGMGHDLPVQAWAAIISAVTAGVARSYE